LTADDPILLNANAENSSENNEKLGGGGKKV
jgi:hypothetical protein